VKRGGAELFARSNKAPAAEDAGEVIGRLHRRSGQSCRFEWIFLGRASPPSPEC